MEWQIINKNKHRRPLKQEMAVIFQPKSSNLIKTSFWLLPHAFLTLFLN